MKFICTNSQFTQLKVSEKMHAEIIKKTLKFCFIMSIAVVPL